MLLSVSLNYFIGKRFMQTNTEVASRLPLVAEALSRVVSQRNGIVPYDPRILAQIIKFRNFNNPHLTAQLYKQNQVKEDFIKILMAQKISSQINLRTEATQRALDYYFTKDLEKLKNFHMILEQKILNKEIISEDSLMNLLNILNNAEIALLETPEGHNLFFALRRYFFIYSPQYGMGIGELFLAILKKANYSLVSEPLFPPIEKNEVLDQVASKDVKPVITHEEKQTNIEKRIPIIIKTMDDLFVKYNQDSVGLLKSKEIQLWYDHINTRGNTLPLSNAEIIINEKLKKLLQVITKEKASSFATKDPLQKLKDQSSLPTNLLQPLDNPVLPQDFEKSIDQITHILELVRSEKGIERRNVLLLNENIGICTFQQNRFEFTAEVYKYMYEHPEEFKFKFVANNLDIDILKDILETTDPIVLLETKSTEAEILPSYLTHKTLVLPELEPKVHLSMLTSAQHANNDQLDSTQPTNFNPAKNSSPQMLHGFYNPILFEKNEKRSIDIETSLLFQGNNSKGDPYRGLFKKHFLKQLSLKRPYIEPYDITDDLLCQLAISFYQQKLDLLQKDYDDLNKTLDSLDPSAYRKKIEQLKEQKLSLFYKKEKQRYVESLSKEERDLFDCVKGFEKRSTIQKDQERIRNAKMLINSEVDKIRKAKLNETEERKRIGNLTAAEKCKTYEEGKKKKDITDETNT